MNLLIAQVSPDSESGLPVGRPSEFSKATFSGAVRVIRFQGNLRSAAVLWVAVRKGPAAALL